MTAASEDVAEGSVHPRPDQAEEPPDDVGATNVDLDEARHGPEHESPAAPEPAHDPDAHDDHAHAAHHDDHPVEDSRWVLVPLLVGLVIGLALVAIFGLGVDAPMFNDLG
jgi:hypothetical protein